MSRESKPELSLEELFRNYGFLDPSENFESALAKLQARTVQYVVRPSSSVPGQVTATWLEGDVPKNCRLNADNFNTLPACVGVPTEVLCKSKEDIIVEMYKYPRMIHPTVCHRLTRLFTEKNVVFAMDREQANRKLSGCRGIIIRQSSMGAGILAVSYCPSKGAMTQHYLLHTETFQGPLFGYQGDFSEASLREAIVRICALEFLLKPSEDERGVAVAADFVSMAGGGGGGGGVAVAADESVAGGGGDEDPAESASRNPSALFASAPGRRLSPEEEKATRAIDAARDATKLELSAETLRTLSSVKQYEKVRDTIGMGFIAKVVVPFSQNSSDSLLRTEAVKNYLVKTLRALVQHVRSAELSNPKINELLYHYETSTLGAILKVPLATPSASPSP